MVTLSIQNQPGPSVASSVYWLVQCPVWEGIAHWVGMHGSTLNSANPIGVEYETT